MPLRNSCEYHSQFVFTVLLPFVPPPPLSTPRRRRRRQPRRSGNNWQKRRDKNAHPKNPHMSLFTHTKPPKIRSIPNPSQIQSKSISHDGLKTHPTHPIEPRFPSIKKINRFDPSIRSNRGTTIDRSTRLDRHRSISTSTRGKPTLHKRTEGRKIIKSITMMLTTTKISAVRAPTKTTRRAGVRQAAHARVAQKVRGRRETWTRSRGDSCENTREFTRE